MLDVMSEIIRWAKSLTYWEQATLDKILGGEPFTDETYQELYGYLLEDAQNKGVTSSFFTSVKNEDVTPLFSRPLCFLKLVSQWLTN